METKCNLKPYAPNTIVDNYGNVYKSTRALGKHLGICKDRIRRSLKKYGYFAYNDIHYYLKDTDIINDTSKNTAPINHDDEDDYQEFCKAKEVKALPFVLYNFDIQRKSCGTRYAVALFSDAHIEETVVPASVLGLNEYNIKIAEQRIKKYFENLAECLIVDEVNSLIFASLGDTISGYIHEELAQCNELSPLEATFKAQSLIYSGLKYLCEKANLIDIKFIGIVGNHSRTTKKIQHANGFKLSYEWLMYKNIETQCKTAKLPVEFCIPESEVAIVDTADNRRFVFCHGFQVKGGTNTVCGIYPSLNRLALKWSKTLKQDKIYLGHFHSCVSITNATVNGSIIGYNSFALSKGFAYEEPAQMYEVYDSQVGELLTRKIYCK